MSGEGEAIVAAGVVQAAVVDVIAARLVSPGETPPMFW
jgi:hypothetical protein